MGFPPERSSDCLIGQFVVQVGSRDGNSSWIESSLKSFGWIEVVYWLSSVFSCVVLVMPIVFDDLLE